MRALATFCLLWLMLCACSRKPSIEQLAELKAAAASLNDTVVEFGPVPSSRWPPIIRKLQPEYVYRLPGGLYITTDSFFVQERGYFIPDTPVGSLPGREADPSYESLGEGVFAYEIKG